MRSLSEIKLIVKKEVHEAEIKPSIEAGLISSEFFAGKSIEEIENAKLLEGRVKRKLKEFFEIESNEQKLADEQSNIRIIIEGDASRFKGISSFMKSGEVIIKGNAGMRTAHAMEGGRVIIEGNTDDFTALEIKGGEVIIKGNAGNYLAGAYRGNWRGMENAKIVVYGNAGSEVASFMLSGEIEIKGNAGDFLGMHMKGGEIKVNGACSIRVGAQMTGGKIAVNKVKGILPSFMPIGEENGYKKFSGDHAERNAKGILLVREIEDGF